MYAPLVSYIIPTYNTPSQLLVDCVNSLLSVNMDEEEREVVVIDDGSDIPAASALHDFEDSIIVIRTDHQGVAEARNVGLDAAKGKYVQFVDSDDELLKQPYEQCLSILKKEQPDILLFKLTSSKENIQDLSSAVHSYTSGAKYMIDNNVYASLPSFFFRRIIAQDLRFTPDVYHEDEEIVPLIFLQAHKFIVTELTPYFYKQREGSIVHSFSSSMVNRRLDDFYNIILRLKIMAENIKTKEEADDEDILKYQAITNTVRRKSLDYVINVIRLHKKEEINLSFFLRWKYVDKRLNQSLKIMKADNLFPLYANYRNFKHAIFRFAVNHRPIRFFLPLMNF